MEATVETGEGILEFNTQLAKCLQGLKKDAGAAAIRQNYRGTGAQSFRRQLFVRFKSGACIDLWLERATIQFGGVVVTRRAGAEPMTLPRDLAYEGKTAEVIYVEVAVLLKMWGA